MILGVHFASRVLWFRGMYPSGFLQFRVAESPTQIPRNKEELEGRRCGVWAGARCHMSGGPGPLPAVFLASSTFLLWLLHFCQSPKVPEKSQPPLHGRQWSEGLPPSQTSPGGKGDKDANLWEGWESAPGNHCAEQETAAAGSGVEVPRALRHLPIFVLAFLQCRGRSCESSTLGEIPGPLVPVTLALLISQQSLVGFSFSLLCF